MTENNRVLEAIGIYLARIKAQISEYTEQKGVAQAKATTTAPLAKQLIEGFKGIPGPVAVIVEIGDTPEELIFLWSLRRG